MARIVKRRHRIPGDRIQDIRSSGYEDLHIVIDDHTRLAFAAILPDHKHTSAIRFFHLARAFSPSASRRAACSPTTAPATEIIASNAGLEQITALFGLLPAILRS